jgi:very-short-patch-repair endonuclease
MPTPIQTKRARDLRKSMTVTERRLWSHLRGHKLDGWKFRRQHPIGDYVVDFVCLAAHLVIELDGSSHDNEAQFDYDEGRQAWLESQGYKVLRFSADSAGGDYLEGVWDTIQFELEQSANLRHPHLAALKRGLSSPPGGGEG